MPPSFSEEQLLAMFKILLPREDFDNNIYLRYSFITRMTDNKTSSGKDILMGKSN